MPKQRGVIARTRKKLGLSPRKKATPKKPKKTGVAGGYSNPGPRKRLLDEAGRMPNRKKRMKKPILNTTRHRRPKKGK